MERNRRVGLLLAFVCFLVAQAFLSVGWFSGADNALLAWCFRLRGPRPPAAELAIVAIDPLTLRAGLGRQWPPQLELYARTVGKLREAKAAVIALDVAPLATFGLADTSPEALRRLAVEIRESANVVLPCVLQPAPGEDAKAPSVPDRFAAGTGDLPVPRELRGGHLAAPPSLLCEAAAGVGHLNVYPDIDGVVRSIPLLATAHGALWPSLALEVVRVYRDLPPGSARLLGRAVALDDATFAVTPEAEMVINFAGGFKHFPHTPLVNVLNADAAVLEETFRGKIVIVGPTASAAFRRTPIHPMMPGVEITANATANLLHGAELKRPAGWIPLLCMLLGALLLGWIVPAAGAIRGALTGVAVVAAACVVTVALFSVGVCMPMAAALFTVTLAGITLVTHAASVADRERAQAEGRLESRMHAIAGIGSLIVSSVDRTQLLDEIVRWVEGELDVPAVSILLMDERRRQLRFEIASGEKGREVKSFTLELGQGVAGTVAATGEPLIIQDARKDPRQARDISDAIGFPAESILCVPMKLHGEVIGVIEALNKRSGPFTAYDESMLTVLGQQAALFLESARLYSELQQRVDEATAGLRQANQDLETQKAKIETLVDEMESGVIATDAHDRVVMWNQAAERFLGMPETRALGEPALAVIRHPRLSQLFAMPLSPLGGYHAEEIEFDVDGRAVIVRASVTLVAEAEGSGKVALLTDITQLKELDRMKMDLVSFVSHELQGPLATIKGFAHLVHRNTEEQSPNARLIRLLENQTSRMQRLVEDLLDVARIEAGIALELRWTDITDLSRMIQDIADLHALTAQDHRFVVDVSEGTPAMQADRGKIEQVLMNLIGNAVKYSPDGGEVAIMVRPQDDEVLFSISDEGIGISEQDLPNLFQRFRRAWDTRERISGTGIGLFLCRHLVEAHGGRVWAESAGKGSIFRFAIPIRSAQEGSVETDAFPPPAETG